MFGLVGIEITLCLAGNSHRVLAFVFFRHGGRYLIASFGSCQGLFGCGLFVCCKKHGIQIRGGIRTLMMSLIQTLVGLKIEHYQRPPKLPKVLEKESLIRRSIHLEEWDTMTRSPLQKANGLGLICKYVYEYTDV